MTQGASMRSQRRAARKVSVRQRPKIRPLRRAGDANPDTAAMKARHVGLRPGLVDEDQTLGINPADSSTEPDEYKVGYGKPPKDTQFRKGQSGNPKGRPKGSKNLA